MQIVLFPQATCVLVLPPAPLSRSAAPARWWWTARRAWTSCLALPSLLRRKVRRADGEQKHIYLLLIRKCKTPVSACPSLVDGMVSNLRRIRLRSNSTGTRPSFRRGASRRIAHQLETPEKPRSPSNKVPKSASVSGLSLVITPGRRHRESRCFSTVQSSYISTVWLRWSSKAVFILLWESDRCVYSAS